MSGLYFFSLTSLIFVFLFKLFGGHFRWHYKGHIWPSPVPSLLPHFPVPSSWFLIPPCSGKDQLTTPPSFPSSLDSVNTSCHPHLKPSFSSSSAALIVLPCLLPKLLSVVIAAVDVLLSSPAEANKERRGIRQPSASPSGPFLLLFGLAQWTTSSTFAEEVAGD